MEFDTKTVVVSAVMSALLILSIWYIRFGEGGWSVKQRIFFSICAVPLSYLMTSWQLNK